MCSGKLGGKIERDLSFDIFVLIWSCCLFEAFQLLFEFIEIFPSRHTFNRIYLFIEQRSEWAAGAAPRMRPDLKQS